MTERRARGVIGAIGVVAMVWLTAPGISLGITPALAQASALSDAQDVNGQSGVVAEIVQARRDGGVLSIRMRLRNTGGSDVSFRLVFAGNYDQYYVVAGSKKYFMLRDSDKTPLATQVNDSDTSVRVVIPKGGSYVWFAKYPEPPDDVKKIDYYTPMTLPFEGVPITD